MARVKAVELVAYGIECDYTGCDVLIPTRNESSRPEGYYIKAERVTVHGSRYQGPELFFHSKQCMLQALEWDFSSLVNEKVK